MKQRRFIAVIAMVLVLVLCVGLLAACNKCKDGHIDEDNNGHCDVCDKLLSDYSSKLHTYNGAMVNSPNTWNPHTYKTADDSVPLDYMTYGLYGYAYNDTYDGYELVPYMAAADPVDVSAEYAKNYDPINDDASASFGLKFDYEQIEKAEYDALLAEGKVQVFVDEYTYALYLDYGYTYEDILQYVFKCTEAEAFAALGVDSKEALLAYEVTDYYKVTEYESGKAFRIALNPDAKWQDGSPITADDYIYSLKALLDPQLMNYRASSVYNGTAPIYNAKNYLYSGQTIMVSDGTLIDAINGGADLYFSPTEDNYLFGPYGGLANSLECEANVESAYWDGYVNYYINAATTAWNAGEDVDPALPRADYATVEEYAQAWVDYKMTGAGANALRLALSNFMEYMKTLTPIEDGDAAGYYEVTDELAAELAKITQAAFGGDYSWAMCSYVGAYPDTTFDEVGFKKIDDYTVDFIFENELIGFYIKKEIGAFWLVHEELYEQCKVQDSTGTWSSTYGTSVETSMSYGPYKMTKFLEGQQMVFERNENWYGYSEKYADTFGTFVRGIDGEVCKQFETDVIVYTQVQDISTREQMFLKGQLASLGLNTELLSKYRTSDAVYFTEGESTFYGIICSDIEKLETRQADASKAQNKEINKTILTIKEFRQALCFAIDRAGLCAALYPAGTPAYGLYSNAIMADPENSISYRSFDAAKKALCNFWGVEYGADKEYKTLDEAYDSITGYDLAKAKELIDIAYDKAIAAGLMTENAIVSLEYCASSESESEIKWFNTFKNNFIDLMKGTKLEGKFEYTSNFTLGNTFGDKIRNGECDTAWGFGWTGDALDPYGLFEVYIDSAYNADGYQYDSWVDWSLVDLTLTLNYNYETGEATATEYTHSVSDWAGLLFGQKDICEAIGQKWTFGQVPDIIRGEVLAALEEQILLNYTTIPMMNEGSVGLLSYKINYGQEHYIYALGYGGIRYMTYNYTDGEWQEFIDNNNGTLTY